MDIQELLNDEEEDIASEEADPFLTVDQLLAVDEDEDELPPMKEEEVEEPIVPTQEAKTCLWKLMQQQEDNLASELASVRRLLDRTESKRILKLEQTITFRILFAVREVFNMAVCNYTGLTVRSHYSATISRDLLLSIHF
ncbi:hypothetical protein BGZ58_010774 [Dissophora ornata]|nr:hypothetical protein BGZ58_010774 [Dissophora ornata]